MPLLRCGIFHFQSVLRAFYIMTYKEQLKDPRWQRVQSEIRQRDNYKCQLCGDTTTFLHVHHIYYQPNFKAWEYDKESLTTLCESCHEFAHKSLPKISALMALSLIRDKKCLFDIELYLRKMLDLKSDNQIIPF